MPFEWFVALRFLREGRMQTVLILAGVAFGVGVMVFLSALINGLQASLIAQTLSSQAHVVVRPLDDQARALVEETYGVRALRRVKAVERPRAIDEWRVVQERVDAVSGVVASAPTVAGSVFAQKGNVSKSVALRGVEPQSYSRIIPLEKHMAAGAFRLVGSETVIGTELAKDLGVQLGDKLRLVRDDGQGEVFSVVGLFDLGNKDVNQRWVFVSLRTAQTMLDLGAKISTVEVRVTEVFDAEAIAARIADRTGLEADSWMTINRQLLIALKSQSSSSYMIQFFVILAVALGIASVLVVSVVQKSREIGILKATGTSTGRVMRVFFIQGGLVGLFGAVVGSGIGTVLALLFANLAKNPDGSPTFPVDLNLGLFSFATVVATAVGLVAAVVPARRAAKLDPAVVIRYG
jgi:lipoprotein-releasing system permease protein